MRAAAVRASSAPRFNARKSLRVDMPKSLVIDRPRSRTSVKSTLTLWPMLALVAEIGARPQGADGSARNTIEAAPQRRATGHSQPIDFRHWAPAAASDRPIFDLLRCHRGAAKGGP